MAPWPLLVGALALPAAQTPPPPSWEVSADAYTYFVPDESNYVQPTVAADRGRLHLEGRFNYEARNTGSLWLGCNFGGGDDSWWAITPMVGAVFGDTKGVAPGYSGWISGHHLELYSEGEFVIDTSSSSDSFFYNWSELTFAPVEWLHVGLVAQRTRAYQTDREIQRGLLVGVSRGKLEASVIVFNPDESKPVVVVTVAVHF